LMPCFCRVFRDFFESMPCFLHFFAVIFYCPYSYSQRSSVSKTRIAWARDCFCIFTTSFFFFLVVFYSAHWRIKYCCCCCCLIGTVTSRLTQRSTAMNDTMTSFTFCFLMFCQQPISRTSERQLKFCRDNTAVTLN